MTDLKAMGALAKQASYSLLGLNTQDKDLALLKVSVALEEHKEEILLANAEDVKRGVENGMHPGMIDRLKLSDERIADMAEGLRTVMGLKDPIGEVIEEFKRPNGLAIRKVRVPMGVIGIIYESRPNVTSDAFGLTFKSGSAVILKGGSDAICSNSAIVRVIRGALEAAGLDPNIIQLIESTDREVSAELIRLNEYINVIIPRGGAGLIKYVVENATVPVIETGTGNCHIYVDAEADIEKAVPIIINAKTQRIGVCNACESLVIHKDIAEKLLPVLAGALMEKQVEIRGDEITKNLVPEAVEAVEEDWGKEYSDYIISMKTVESPQEAIEHINRYSTGHSESIITENKKTAELFLNRIDSACVYANASTRFTDGFEFGFGAEIGISTQKLHARGPMGLKEMTSYKYQIIGNGQIR